MVKVSWAVAMIFLNSDSSPPKLLKYVVCTQIGSIQTKNLQIQKFEVVQIAHIDSILKSKHYYLFIIEKKADAARSITIYYTTCVVSFLIRIIRSALHYKLNLFNRICIINSLKRLPTFFM